MSIPEQLPRILAETADFWAVSKPAGWLVIPGRDASAEEPVLQEWLERTTGSRAWVVHRIDRGTSGVVVFARSAEAHARANGWFENHQVKKEYDAVAVGRMPLPMIRLDSPIEGKPSLTQVERRVQGDEAFLARVRIATGRRHQIRIHLAQAGFPLLGDSQYGGPPEVRQGATALRADRPALHAARLELPHGAGSFEAPWPGDFAEWVWKLKGERKG